MPKTRSEVFLLACELPAARRKWKTSRLAGTDVSELLRAVCCFIPSALNMTGTLCGDYGAIFGGTFRKWNRS